MPSHSLPFNHFSYKAIFIFMITNLPDSGRCQSPFFFWSNAILNEFGMSPFRHGDNYENDSFPQLTFTAGENGCTLIFFTLTGHIVFGRSVIAVIPVSATI